MIGEWKSVYSSSVREAAHDPETNELHIIWADGKHSIYADVPEEKFRTAVNSWSVGRFVHQEVKPFHEHRYG